MNNNSLMISFSTLKILATVKHDFDLEFAPTCFSTLKILATVKRNISECIESIGFSTLKILATVKPIHNQPAHLSSF